MFINIIKKYLKNKRLVKNIFSQINLNISSILIQFFFPPLMILIYGLENFGVWIFITSIPSVLNALNININNASRTEMTIFYNRKKFSEVQSIYVNSVFITSIITGILVLITVFIINCYNFNIEIFKNIEVKNVKIILNCVLISFYINFFSSIFEVGISYKGRIDVVTYLNIFFSIFSSILILLLGYKFKNLVFAGYAVLITSVIHITLFYIAYLKFSKKLRLFDINLVSKKKLLILLKLSIPFFLDSLQNILKHSFQIVILGIFFNAQVVGLVSTMKTLFYFFPIKIWSIISNPLLFEFTRLYALKSFNLLKKNYFSFIKLFFITGIIFLCISSIAGKFIYSYWLNSKYSFSYILFLLIVFDTVIFQLSWYYSILQRSFNKFQNISLFSTFINIFILLFVLILFTKNINYYFLFNLNLLGSILILAYNYLSTKNLIKFKF